MRAAVLGRPVGHSLSPLLHRAAYAALGLPDWTYDALDIGADDLPVLLAGLGEEWRGFSVTMPCKQAAADVADVVEPLPRLLHAANTLVRTDAGWRAENTDVLGVGTTLQQAGVTSVDRAAIVGAGGTAAAAAVALASAVVDAQVVVSTVPVGGQPAVARLPWTAEQTVLDVLYDPWPTPLASAVTQVGGTVVGGLEVLFWQATAQVELMTGQPAPLVAMRGALDAAVGHR